MISKLEAIISLNPEAEATQMADGSLVWHKNPTNITDEQITAKQSELQTEYNNNKYQRDRANSYPSIADQLDDIYHNGIDGWKATIKTTKDKYPKESS